MNRYRCEKMQSSDRNASYRDTTTATTFPREFTYVIATLGSDQQHQLEGGARCESGQTQVQPGPVLNRLCVLFARADKRDTREEQERRCRKASVRWRGGSGAGEVRSDGGMDHLRVGCGGKVVSCRRCAPSMPIEST